MIRRRYLGGIDGGDDDCASAHYSLDLNIVQLGIMGPPVLEQCPSVSSKMGLDAVLTVAT